MSTDVPAPLRRAHRATDGALLGGVASGLAEHLRVPVLWVRIAFLVAAALNGFGAVVYAGLWMWLPAVASDEEPPGLAAGRRGGRRPIQRLADQGPLVAVGVIVIGVLALLTSATGHFTSIWPGLLAAAGVALLWWQSDEAKRQRWVGADAVTPLRAIVGTGWISYARVGLGALLLVVAIAAFLLASLGISSWGSVVGVTLAAALGVAALAVIVGPWLQRLARDLSDERAERVRSQERADVAAHLHDSVLQTLALIQKSSGDQATVARLARAQERDLRSWLYEAPAAVASSFAAALRATAAEIEDQQGVPVEVVCVGDRAVGSALQPLILATREAILNAARHSGAARIDVYAEVGDAEAQVFVRDRGRGFALDAVPSDRHGVRGSILERTRRHGGEAEIVSAPGQGTEVRLRMPFEPTPEA